MAETLKRFHWENEKRVVEIVGSSLVDARLTALSHLVMHDLPTLAFVRDNDPNSIEDIVGEVEKSDVFNTWLKNV